MIRSRFLARLLPALSALALCANWAASQAAPAASRATAFSTEPRAGRVIVKFRSNATVVRERILAAPGDFRSQPSAEAVAHRLQARASSLGHRNSVVLRAGRGLDERTQVVMSDDLSSSTLAARLSHDPEVEYAVVDKRHRRLRVPNDPLFAPSPVPVNGPAVGQWYLKAPQANTLTTGNEIVSAINAQAAWDITTGNPDVIVAVLDTGVRREHPDLAGKLLAGYDFISDADLANDGDGRDSDPSDPGDWVTQQDTTTTDFEDCDITDSSWHGTATAGLVGAATDNAQGMAGAGWGVRVLPMRVLGKCFGYESDITAAMRWAAGVAVPGVPANPTPAKVLNLSLGRPGACDGTYPEAIAAVRARGAVIVASAGNTTGHAVNVPANCSGVIGVAAVRHIGTKVGFSDVGPELTIAAPGGNCVNTDEGQPCLFPIVTTSNSGTTTPGSSIYTDSFNISVGTSFSAPLVSATVALMVSANSSLTPDQVRRLLRATARSFPGVGAPADDLGPIQTCRPPDGVDQLQCYCTTLTCGAGLLDAAAAVQQSTQLVAFIDEGVTSAQAGQTITFTSNDTVVPAGRTIASYSWTQNGTVLGTGSSVAVVPTAAGVLTVDLTVTDSSGATSTTSSTVTVSAAPSSGGGGGGGALNPGWLLALCAAALALRRAGRAA